MEEIMHAAVRQHITSREVIVSTLIDFLKGESEVYNWYSFRGYRDSKPDDMYLCMAKAYCEAKYWNPQTNRFEANKGWTHWDTFENWHQNSKFHQGTWHTVEKFIKEIFVEAYESLHPQESATSVSAVALVTPALAAKRKNDVFISTPAAEQATKRNRSSTSSTLPAVEDVSPPEINVAAASVLSLSEHEAAQIDLLPSHSVLLDATIGERVFTHAEEQDLIKLLLTFEAIEVDAAASTVTVVEQPPQNVAEVMALVAITEGVSSEVTAGSAAAATTTMATTAEHSTAIAATAVPSTVAVLEAASIPRRSERLSGSTTAAVQPAAASSSSLSSSVAVPSLPPPALVSHTAKKRDISAVATLSSSSSSSSTRISTRNATKASSSSSSSSSSSNVTAGKAKATQAYATTAPLVASAVASASSSSSSITNAVPVAQATGKFAIHIFWDNCSLKCSIKVTQSRTRIMKSYYTMQLSTGFDSIQVKDLVLLVRYKLDAYPLHSLNLQRNGGVAREILLQFSRPINSTRDGFFFPQPDEYNESHFLTVNFKGSKIVHSFIIPCLEEISFDQKLLAKAKAQLKHPFSTHIDEGGELRPYMDAFLVPGEILPTYWNRFSDRIRFLWRNYKPNCLGFGQDGGGQLSLNPLSAINCAFKLCDLVIEAKLKGLMRIGYGNFEEGFFDIEVLKSFCQRKILYMGIEPVEECVTYVHERMVSLEVKSGNIQVQLTANNLFLMEEIPRGIQLLYTTAAIGPRFSIHLLKLGIQSSHVKFIVADLSSNVTHIVDFLKTLQRNVFGASSTNIRDKLQTLGIIFQFVEAYVADEKITDDMPSNRRDLYILDLYKLRSQFESATLTVTNVIGKLKRHYRTLPEINVDYKTTAARVRPTEGHFAGAQADVDEDDEDYEPSENPSVDEEESEGDVGKDDEDDEVFVDPNTSLTMAKDDDDEDDDDDVVDEDDENKEEDGEDEAEGEEAEGEEEGEGEEEHRDEEGKGEEEVEGEEEVGGEEEGEEEGEVEVKNVLLLGMVYGNEERVKSEGGQVPRDTIRCEAVEKLGFNVYTMDQTHEPSEGKSRRHFKGNFARFRYIKKDMQKKFPKFDEIHLEFIRCPEPWCEDNWTPDFFRETLPGFITSGILSDKGTIYLPRKRIVLQNKIFLSKYFNVVEVVAKDSILFVASTNVNHKLIHMKDAINLSVEVESITDTNNGNAFLKLKKIT